MTNSLRSLSAKSAKQQKIVATELRKQRIKAELSQDELAQRAGIDRKTINRIENEHFSPTLDTITRLCVVLKITPSTLFGSGRGSKK
ncbi:MAG: XRE family transcriptional regulator [Actinobacteria bacterium]|nr:XRE family transcriptional regulator [Actinomycetota bacterium]NDC90991.1 XRE family transcriptional regulator [Acidimicrobiia bacterium]NDB27310.1 XRE family transcriptional regulator [Actinomycetota bacterium]NDB41744.1 XRE family transcriptional regulator [Actinomycetota bacterium]NDD71990.1 XRE family transcriptional regulator [Actinomycetota bacterium]